MASSEKVFRKRYTPYSLCATPGQVIQDEDQYPFNKEGLIAAISCAKTTEPTKNTKTSNNIFFIMN
jgi:hypothetical protein